MDGKHHVCNMKLLYENAICFYLLFSDEIVSQILDELGIQLTQQLPEAPLDSKTGKGKLKQAAEVIPGQDQSNSIDDELLARLENLRRK